MPAFVYVHALGPAGGHKEGLYHTADATLWFFHALDRYFQSIHGGSFANHFYLISASVALVPDAPAEHRAQVAPDGRVVKDGDVTPDGFIVNNPCAVV